MSSESPKTYWNYLKTMLKKTNCGAKPDLESLFNYFKTISNVEIWGYEDHKLLVTMHTKFLRKVLQLKQSTPLNMLYGKRGKLPHFNQKSYDKLLELDENC